MQLVTPRKLTARKGNSASATGKLEMKFRDQLAPLLGIQTTLKAHFSVISRENCGRHDGSEPEARPQ